MTSPEKPIRIVLADDHPIVRAGIRAELDKLPGVVVAGEASDGREALEMIGELQPNVVFMDISMKSMNGIEATSRMTREFPHVRVIILSVHQNEEYFWQALKAGASGYLLKKAAIAELSAALERVAGRDLLGVVAAPEPERALRRGAVREALGVNLAGGRPLEPVVAHRRRRAQRLLHVARVELPAIAHRPRPDPRQAIRLQLEPDGERIGLVR